MPAKQQSSSPRRWTERFQVGSYWADRWGAVFPHVILQWLQEAAWHHAEVLGFGHSDLRARDSYWVLSRISLQLRERPSWGSTVELETWPTSAGRLMAFREFLLRDDTGAEWGRAVSGWLVLDATTGRPRNPEQFLEELQVPVSPGLGGDPPRKIRHVPENGPQEGQERRAAYSDLDPQDHVNNACYAAWMFDQLSPDWMAERRLTEMHLNFLKETRWNETVRVGHERVRKEGELELVRHAVWGENGRKACLMETEWAARTSEC